MKKIIYTLAVVVLTTTLMVGCGSKTKTTDTQNKQETQSTSTNDASTQQKDIQKADLEGEVTSISGNKITLKLIKTPDAPTGGTDGTANGSQGKAPAGDAGKDADKTKSVDNKDGHDSKAPENMKVEYTGETKDITISDEVKIKAMSMGTQGAESKEIAYKDIKVEDVLQITYSDKDKETISTINVRQAVNQK